MKPRIRSEKQTWMPWAEWWFHQKFEDMMHRGVRGGLITLELAIDEYKEELTEEQIIKLREYGKQKTEDGLQTGSDETKD